LAKFILEILTNVTEGNSLGNFFNRKN
jgi:hypothetical protein